MPNPLITLTTDFGLSDQFAGVMKGVISGIAPSARVIDISHNIAVVKKIASRVIVMFEGRLVEEGSALEVFSHPKSDYTKKLLEAAG